MAAPYSPIANSVSAELNFWCNGQNILKGVAISGGEVILDWGEQSQRPVPSTRDPVEYTAHN